MSSIRWTRASLLYSGFAITFVTLSNVNALKVVSGKIKISIVTTAGCSDTAEFITHQLKDAYWKYKKFLKVEFVPWGRTRYKQDGRIWCQFGTEDCWANRVHRCALSLLKNQDDQVLYMICEFSNPKPAYSQRSYSCASARKINLYDLDHCVTNTGRILDDAAERKARRPMRYINFVPAIYFNDVVNDVDAHDQAITSLKNTLCFALANDHTTGVTNCGSRLGNIVWDFVQKEIKHLLKKVL